MLGSPFFVTLSIKPKIAVLELFPSNKRPKKQPEKKLAEIPIGFWFVLKCKENPLFCVVAAAPLFLLP